MTYPESIQVRGTWLGVINHMHVIIIIPVMMC